MSELFWAFYNSAATEGNNGVLHFLGDYSNQRVLERVNNNFVQTAAMDYSKFVSLTESL